MWLKRIHFLLCFFCFTGLFSQQTALWTEVGLDINLPKKLELSLSGEMRTNTNYGFDIQQFFPQVGLSYKINKFTKASVDYRFIQKREENQYFYTRQKFYMNIGNDFDIQRLKVKNRIRYTYLSKSYIEDKRDLIPKKHLRDKIELVYNIRKNPIDPFVSFEVFHPLNSNQELFVDEYRIGLGASFPINKHQDLETGIIYSNERFDAFGRSYVLSLKYSFGVKVKKKKDKKE